MRFYNKLSGGVWVLIGGGVVVVLLIIMAIISGQSSGGKTTREMALICTTDMATEFHIHSHLQIVINGQALTLAEGIGIKSGCMNPLHTHDATGKIHVESPEKRDFTLADFFAVWGKTFTKDQILEYKVDDKHSIQQTVNGKVVDDYENTILRDGDQIVISYTAQ